MAANSTWDKQGISRIGCPVGDNDAAILSKRVRQSNGNSSSAEGIGGANMSKKRICHITQLTTGAMLNLKSPVKTLL